MGALLRGCASAYGRIRARVHALCCGGHDVHAGEHATSTHSVPNPWRPIKYEIGLLHDCTQNWVLASPMLNCCPSIVVMEIANCSGST